MFVIYDEIRLDPSVRSISLNETEWAINPKTHCMQHEPTKTLFHIFMNDEASEKKSLNIGDFSARLVAIGEGCALPEPDVITTLGRSALVLYFVALGYIRPNEEADGNLPDGVQQAYVC
jgi:hypothetical protein